MHSLLIFKTHFEIITKYKKKLIIKEHFIFQNWMARCRWVPLHLRAYRPPTAGGREGRASVKVIAAV